MIGNSGQLSPDFLKSIETLEPFDGSASLLQDIGNTVKSGSSNPDEISKVLELIAHIERMEKEAGTAKWFEAPYHVDTLPKHKAFFDASAKYNEVLFMAANRCHAAGTKVWMADGTEKNIEDIVEGEEVLAFDTDTENLVTTTVVDTFAGIADNVRAYHTPTSSRRILSTTDHPFLVRPQRGVLRQVQADKLKYWDKVVVPTKWEMAGADPGFTEDVAKLLGLLVGDGYLAAKEDQFKLTNADQDILAFAERVARNDLGLDPRLVSYKSWNDLYFPKTKKVKGKSSLAKILQATELYGTKSHDKFVPEQILLAPEGHVKAFINGLLAADGHYRKGRIELFTVSEQLAKTYEKACLRLGVPTTLQSSWDGNDNHNIKYTVTITGDTYLDVIGASFHKTPVYRGRTRKVKGKASVVLKPGDMQPTQEIYCITVAHPDHLFVANGYVNSNTGKSVAGAYALTCHLTGNYPVWWNGRVFDHPIEAWAVGKDARATRDTLQKELLGGIGEWGTGMLPAYTLGKFYALQGVPQGIDIIKIRHKSGGWSELGFKNYQQDVGSFMGTTRHVVLCDEEVPIEIYNEANIRTATVDGLMLLTFTPLAGLTPLVVNFCKNADFLVGAKPIVAMDQYEAGEDWDGEGEQAVGNGRSKCVITAGWDDVPWLTEHVKTRLLEDTPEFLREARSKGLPAMGSGNVYPTQVEQVLVDPFAIPDSWPRMYGLDVGWNRCLAKNSMVMLPDGTHCPIQDLHVGDEVLGFDFATEELVSTKVVDTFRGFANNMVTVGISEEQTITCTDDHPFAHRAQPRDKIKFKKVREINDRIREFQSVVLPSRWNPEKEARVSSDEMARILGYLLGDGCLTYKNRRLEFSQVSEIFIEDMRECLESVGCKMSSYANNTAHHLSGAVNGVNPVLDFIREKALLGTTSSTKFIPKDYFTATSSEVENLLVGLIHTDGSVEGDNIRYYTVSKQLAEDVKILCLRLGIYASISKDSRRRKETHNAVYRVTLRRPTTLPLLSPKQLKPAKPERKKRTDRLLSKYEIAPHQDIYCITVEHPDHAFVCNGFVVSNTAAVWAALDPNTDTLYVYDEHYLGKEPPSTHAYGIRSRGEWINGAIDPAANGRSQTDGKQLIRSYKDLGLIIFEAKNEVEAGVQIITQRLAANKIKIFRTCINLIKEYMLYRRDKNGRIVKENDHALDALRYIVNNMHRMTSKSENKATMGAKYSAKRYDI